MALDRFSAPVRAWFETSFAAPTDAQAKGWPAIADGDHTLLLAPTGSGKTLAAFLWAIDRLGVTARPPKDRRCRVLYVSPLRALAFDVEKNLRAPLSGITLAAERLGAPFDAPTVAMRTGDTSGKERQQLVRNPPDILITTPESLYLMLTSRARDTLRGVQTVIIDEIHALAPTKRGAHLMLSLERLEAITDAPPQRIGLSATQRPLDEIARFLGGYGEHGSRAVTVVDAGSRKSLDVEVIVPVDDMNEPGAHSVASGAAAGALGLDDPETNHSIWPHVHPRILELIRAHRSTIVFVNSRRLAERLALRLNELAGEELVRAHHGSLAREERLGIEEMLKDGRLPALVATSSLELGIDMGSVDLVIQVESPGSVARGLQRIGRAGHQVGAASRGVVFPKYRGDLVQTAVVAERMKIGAI
ncbi:MAG TPA: DEAD/DEAH box helicase, partial [Acidimicrobiia bacterium]